VWHYGVKCTKDDGSDLRWNAIGDIDSNANRCPNCNAPFEKNGGCPHMTCSVC